jgi:hypothetical protein
MHLSFRSFHCAIPRRKPKTYVKICLRTQLPFVLLKTSKSTHILVEVSVDGRVSCLVLLELFDLCRVYRSGLYLCSVFWVDLILRAPVLAASSLRWGVCSLTVVFKWQEALLHIDREFELQDDVAILRSLPEFSHINLVCFDITCNAKSLSTAQASDILPVLRTGACNATVSCC